MTKTEFAQQLDLPQICAVNQGKHRLFTAAQRRKPFTGKGAVSLDGRLIDYASIRQAEVLVKKAEQIAAN